MDTRSPITEAKADHIEYETEKFNENLTIQASSLKTIDFELNEGTKFEVIFSIQIQENLPIDIWFVNEDNYMLLTSDVNFLYFIDGSDSEVTYTKKILELAEEDLYKLVMANYNNQTVNANIIYEVRTFSAESSTTSSEDLPVFTYILFVTIIILGVFLFVLYVKGRNYKQSALRASSKVSNGKKAKKSKPKRSTVKVSYNEPTKVTRTRRVKKITPNVTSEEPSGEYKNVVPKKAKSEEPKVEPSEDYASEKTKPKISKKILSRFCGFCGTQVSTPFCKNCGNKV
jgi:hypothetical protein